MRTDRELLSDMLEAIDEIMASTPQDEAEYWANKFLRSHLVRNIQVVGEAAARLTESIRAAHPEVPWRSIIGMRHILVHGYFQVDWEAVYDTALRDVPQLRESIEATLAQLPSDPD